MKLNNEERKFKKLSELVSFSKTTLIPVDNQVYNYISLEHIESQTGRLINFSPTIWKQIKSGKVVFKKWMILYGKLRPYLNKVYIAEFDGIASTEILPMIVDDCIVTDYLALFLRSDKFVDQANNSISWARMPRVTTKFFQEYDKIPLPPLEEQKKIVAYLDELNATISKLKSEYQSQLAMLDEIRNSSLDLAFWGSRERERAYNLNSWKWVKLGEVVTLWPKKSQIASISDDLKISFVPMADLSQEKMLFETKEVRTLGEVRKGYTYFEDRDVLLAKVTPCFENGKCGVARDLKNGIWFWSSEFFVFRMSESILPEYFYYFVSGKWFRKEWAKNMGWAVGLQRVKQEWIKNVEIPLPDLETQSQIVSHLDQVHQQITMLKTQVNSQIEHCDELWQSSLEKVLTQGTE